MKIDTDHPVIFEGRSASLVSIIGFIYAKNENELFCYLSVPWINYSQDEIDKYIADRDAGIRSESNLNFVTKFNLPEGFNEVKEWEYLRDIEAEEQRRKEVK